MSCQFELSKQNEETNISFKFSTGRIGKSSKSKTKHFYWLVFGEPSVTPIAQLKFFC